MRVASLDTLKKNRKTRLMYAYRAMERLSLESSDPEAQERADDAMNRLNDMSMDEMLDWAFSEKLFREMN